ncbi:MAG: hypothetical protein J5759_05640 [Bacteroidales bacterium]|nr:hypothetical protein [Bacteroidales bacterium]
MKKTLIIAALAAAAFAVSCQSEVAVDAPQDGIAHDYITVTLELPTPEPATKISINETDGKVSWVAGDQIYVHGKLYSEAKTITLTADDISDDGHYATITFDKASMEAFGDHDYYASYPASAVGQFLSSSKAEHNCEFIDTNKPLMAAYLDKDAGVFKFRNLCAVISFKVTGDYDSYVFSGNDDETIGYGQFAIKRHVTDTYTKARNNPVTILTGDVVTDGTTPNLICIPEGVKFADGFAIRLKKGSEIVKEAKTTNLVELGRRALLPLGDITSQLGPYVPVAHHSSITNAHELGATEPANCYIITEPGSYKIPVVKGNTHESAGNRAKTKLLWETYNNDQEVVKNSVIAAVDYDDDDNFVYFKTPDTLQPGNALIAAVDEDDVILWSWHIWIPNTTIHDIADGNFYNKELMDRHLGALEAVPDAATAPTPAMYGLYYQWGRKDPMFTKDTSKGGITATANITFVGNSDAGTRVSTEESIKTPTTFYYSGEGGTYNWNSEEITDLWDKDGVDKTIYDPCPAGYRVPKYDDNLAMWKYNVATGWTSDKDNGWFKYGENTFPYAGYASSSSLSYAKIRTVIWSAKYNSVERGYCAYIRSDKSPIYNYYSYYKPYLGSVRCCKIEGEVAIPEPDPATPATGISIDGGFTDWSDGEAIAGDGAYIDEWKYGSDASNIYFYFKIPKSKINYDDKEFQSDGITPNPDFGYYTHKRYIYVAFDTDNNKETGAEKPDYGGLKIPGTEALALIFPWRGHKDDSNSPSIVSGEDEEGWMKNLVSGEVDGHPVVAGVFDGDYALIEVALAKDKLGSPAPGKYKIQFSYSWNLTDIFPIAIN